MQIDVDGDALLGIEAHEFFLDDQLFAEGWSAREPNPIVIHVNRLNAEIHHRAQQIADISGDCVLVPDINAPTDWVVLTPDPMQKAAGNIEYDATTGARCLRHEDGTRRRIQPEEHLGRLKGAGFHKTAFEIADKTVVVYRDLDLWLGDGGAVADNARDMLAKTRQLGSAGYQSRCWESSSVRLACHSQSSTSSFSASAMCGYSKAIPWPSPNTLPPLHRSRLSRRPASES
ncbi:MAG: hypothetical protein E5X80_10360 [Mesorhizobium sp.]|uniref:hypothetical protein n=1 Tax=Mesorhizobium sp. TaxID=1871066 RepID=UPI001221919D|nr:hypothetical protein [Mesorhizobium sp.]TIO59702.1 MAG: hypothetical protein E5X79_15235 [Mesorhizobium sp.]TJV65476.1 MAG: hypothetical protein E5X80_10360 [Mesorhizobium sp.]